MTSRKARKGKAKDGFLNGWEGKSRILQEYKRPSESITVHPVTSRFSFSRVELLSSLEFSKVFPEFFRVSKS